jgi:hypothetical protein
MAELTIKDCINVIQSTINGCRSFKIGKTGQTTTERYNQEYATKYSRITAICQSPTSSIIDRFEAELIKYFKNYPANDNQQDGGGDMGKSSMYYVYFVWR